MGNYEDRQYLEKLRKRFKELKDERKNFAMIIIYYAKLHPLCINPSNNSGILMKGGFIEYICEQEEEICKEVMYLLQTLECWNNQKKYTIKLNKIPSALKYNFSNENIWLYDYEHWEYILEMIRLIEKYLISFEIREYKKRISFFTKNNKYLNDYSKMIEENKYCNKCGKELYNNGYYCSYCGGKMK